MEPEELFAAARARARKLDIPRAPEEAALERLRAESAAWFDQVPEPPLYPRLDDPTRQTAQQLIPAGQELLARCVALSRHEGENKIVASLVPALEAHLATLCHIAEGRLERAERDWHRAMELERGLERQNRLWVRNDEDPRPVFDQTTRASRYDPGPEPSMTVKLVCPRRNCGAQERFRLSPRYSTHRFECPRCRKPFLGHFGEVRSVEKSSRRGYLRYLFRIVELSGEFAQVQFDERTGVEFPVGRRDLVVFLYDELRELQGTLNLSNGKVLWVRRPDGCFLATAVFGEGAPELETFRAFRDRALLPRRSGRALVRAYYALGPAMAAVVTRSPALRRISRAGLERIRRWLRRRLGAAVE
ncbi:MAG TPA: CFI-box-CTERM domain-containing protein [Myxococcaceae bacterium]|nr:CFI-box-CTERM domain-containing protein [Myxococcaceae bacterium]